MSHLFADTYFFIALLSPGDKDHQRALSFTQSFTGRLTTTAWVLTEVADALCRPPIRTTVGRFIERLAQRPDVVVHPNDEGLFVEGLAFFFRPGRTRSGRLPIASPSWSWNARASRKP